MLLHCSFLWHQWCGLCLAIVFFHEYLYGWCNLRSGVQIDVFLTP